MLGIFVNCANYPYAALIAAGIKTIETRTRNTLKALDGQRVAIIETGRGPAKIVGYATISGYSFCNSYFYEMLRDETKIPVGDKYDKFGSRDGIPGKWFYYLENAEQCDSYELPEDGTIRHGRSWCQFFAP